MLLKLRYAGQRRRDADCPDAFICQGLYYVSAVAAGVLVNSPQVKGLAYTVYEDPPSSFDKLRRGSYSSPLTGEEIWLAIAWSVISSHQMHIAHLPLLSPCAFASIRHHSSMAPGSGGQRRNV